MASISELRMILFQIRGKLIEHPVFTRQRGLPVDDPAMVREVEELKRLGSRLGLAIRELKNKANLLEVRKENLWKVAPQDRFGMAAGIRGQEAELNDVLNLAKELKKLFEDLFRKSGLIGEGETAQGVGEFIEKMYHQAHMHGEVQSAPPGLSYTAPAKGEFGGSIEGVTILVFVALEAFVYAMKRAKGKN